MNIEKKVADKLRQWGVDCNFKYLGDMSDDKEWAHDLFYCAFNGTGFDYKTGLGHRVTKSGWQWDLKSRAKIKEVKEALKNRKGVGYHSVTASNGAILPQPAGVLHCLLMDASASDESFNNWCDNYEYDNDSISAFNTYQQCCETGNKLRQIFNNSQLAELRELLEDY